LAKSLYKQPHRLCLALLGLLLISAPALAVPAQNSTYPVPAGNTNATLSEPDEFKALETEESFLLHSNATFNNISGTDTVDVEMSAHNATVATPSASTSELEVPTFSWGGYFKGIGALFLILAALWGVLWFLRRRGSLPGMGGLPRDAFSVEAQVALSPKKKLVLVRFLNSRLLLGVTDQQITLIKEVEAQDGPEESTNSHTRSFAEVIKDVSQKNDDS
jgi:flagellar biosynthetic protein FliO